MPPSEYEGMDRLKRSEKFAEKTLKRYVVSVDGRVVFSSDNYEEAKRVYATYKGDCDECTFKDTGWKAQ